MRTQSKLLSLLFVCVVAAAGATAAFLWRHLPPIELATGTMITPARRSPDFSLIDNHGRGFSAANLRGHWSLMFFGYTNCPDFCPTTLTTLAAITKQLRAANAPVLPQVLFVSVDAQRDTPQQLSKYVPYFDPDFIGLTASDQPAIEDFAKRMGVAVIIHPPKDGSYLVDHSAEIFVFNPDGNLTAVLMGPFTVDAVRDDFQRIVAGHA